MEIIRVIFLWLSCLPTQKTYVLLVFSPVSSSSISTSGVSLWWQCLRSPSSCTNTGLCRSRSVAKSCLTLPPHGLQHARLPCVSPFSGVCSNSCSLSQWCHPTILFSAVPFFSFSASWSFSMSQVFASGGQSIGASVSVLPMNILSWFPLGLTSLISLLSKGLSSLL